MQRKTKIRLAIAFVASLVAVPSLAFASHAASCCGSLECCLRHLGCC
jgi:hypothetical protein